MVVIAAATFDEAEDDESLVTGISLSCMSQC